MARIDASRIIAEMVNGLTFHEFSVIEGKRDAVCPSRKPDSFLILHAEKSVAVAVHHAGPLPTPVSFDEFTFETLEQIDRFWASFHGSSIPNYYTEFIGRQLLAVVSEESVRRHDEIKRLIALAEGESA